MRAVRPAGPVFFPLDEELELLPGPLSPRLQEDLVHLSTWMPFERAATELAYFTRVEVSDTSVRRHTETAGAAYVAVQTAALEQLERERPAGPDVLQVSADGAMVPLIGGEWAEVKTVRRRRAGRSGDQPRWGYRGARARPGLLLAVG